MIEITIDGNHADIAESDSDLFVLSLIAYEVDDVDNMITMRNVLTIYDAILPIVEDIQYTVGDDPKIIEFEYANFTNWQPTPHREIGHVHTRVSLRVCCSTSARLSVARVRGGASAGNSDAKPKLVGAMYEPSVWRAMPSAG